MNKYTSLLFLYFILSVLYILLTQNIPNSLSLSPSFERQEINDVKSGGDWIFWPSANEEENIVAKNGRAIPIPTANNESQCIFEMPLSPDIKSVSYTSDGDMLNASIWVSSPLLDRILLNNEMDSENFNSNTSFMPLWHKLRFTMALDVFSIFNEGIDYRVDLFNEKNSTHNQWKKEVYEISADDTSKVISTEFFDEFPYQEKEFVDFSVDLKSISNPQKYRILFYITDLYVKDGKLCRMVDSTNWVLSPPPEFNVVVSPNSIFMRPGEEKDILVTISGNTELQSNGTLNVGNINDNNGYADTKFLSNETVISSFANGSSILNIKIPNVEINKSKHLIIPIDANISFPTDIINKGGETFYNNKSISLLEHSNLVLTVLPSLTLTERLGEIANTFKPVGDLWQIIVPIVLALIGVIAYFNKKRSNKGKKEKVNKKIDES